MKLFLKNIFVFALPFLSLCFFLDLYISQTLKTRNSFSKGENLVWNDIYNGNFYETEAFIYGSSRAWVHIDPEILAENLHINFSNLGIDGHNFYLQYFRHLELIENYNFPEIIIYSVDEFTLAKRKDLYNYDQFLPYMLGNSKMEKFLTSYKGFSKMDFYFPLLRYIGEDDIFYTAFFKDDENEPVRIKGYQGVDKSWNSDLDKAKNSIEPFHVEIDSISLVLFKTFLQKAKKCNTQIIFVYTPEFIQGQEIIENRSEILGIYENLSNDLNIPFLDYSNHRISYEKQYFYNAMHMNKRGSEIFSQELAEDLQNLLIIPDLAFNNQEKEY